MKTIERVGVLVVHGIGQQRQFENLESIVRNIAAALQADSAREVTIRVNASDTAEYLAEKLTLQTGETPTAIIRVEDNQKITELEFNEVWWSDLDESRSLQKFISFWGWGLSLWTKPRYVAPKHENPSQNFGPGKPMSLPRGSTDITWIHRIYLFLVSFVILLILPLLYLLGGFLRNILGLNVRPDILVDYLGDVKLYQQAAREGEGSLVDLGKNPPRVSIRRRCVRGLVEMSMRDYDRWYVLAHSLGSVVAFNGLMEPEDTLPNYLSQEVWERWCKYVDQKQQAGSKGAPPLAKKPDKPFVKRPYWLNADDTIDRDQLFEKLQGFMTYGSPLSKFAVLWPAIVPFNNQAFVNEKFEWLNVFDPTDPVSDFTRFYEQVHPHEVPYKAGQIHLLSHVQYLTFNPKRPNPLAQRTAKWLLDGGKFDVPPYSWGWPKPKNDRGRDSFKVSFYFGLGIAIWFLAGILISLFLSVLLPPALTRIGSFLVNLLAEHTPGLLIALGNWVANGADISFSTWMILIPSITALVVFIIGVAAYWLGLNKTEWSSDD